MAELELRPITLKVGNEFISLNHRHNGRVTGWKFGVGLCRDETLVGVGMGGRPVSRHMDDGVTLEVTRVCTLGDRNANSMIYGALLRAGRALGYQRIITYTLESEGGSSLKAVGFVVDAVSPGGEWDTPTRRRRSSGEVGYTPEPKLRWVA